MPKKILLLIVLTLTMVLAFGCKSKDDDSIDGVIDDSDDIVVAVVNGEKILKSEVDLAVQRELINYSQYYEQFGVQMSEEEKESLTDELKVTVLESLIEEKALIHEAIRVGLTVIEDEVTLEFEGITSSFPTEEEYQQWLEVNNFTEEELIVMIRNYNLIRQLISDITVTEEEIIEAYNEFKEEMEAEAEETDEPFPTYEELRDNIEYYIFTTKQEELYLKVLEEALSNSEIERF